MTPGGKRVVLLVDDDSGVRRVVQKVLDLKGYQVKIASDGDQALDLLEAGEVIDLVLTDIVMPGMSGVQLALLLHEVAPALPVLFMSGYPANFLDDERIRGRTALLKKPFRASELLDAVARALDGSTAGGEEGERPGVPS